MERYTISIVIGAVALIAAAFFASTFLPTDEPFPYTTPATLGGASLMIEVVDTPEARSRGLSGRESLPEDAGMLFTFPTAVIPSFWMKDMNFAIDIVWLDRNRTVVGIEQGVAPETFPQQFSPPEPIRHVLEVNAGWAAKNSINIGDRLIIN